MVATAAVVGTVTAMATVMSAVTTGTTAAKTMTPSLVTPSENKGAFFWMLA